MILWSDLDDARMQQLAQAQFQVENARSSARVLGAKMVYNGGCCLV